MAFATLTFRGEPAAAGGNGQRAVTFCTLSTPDTNDQHHLARKVNELEGEWTTVWDTSSYTFPALPNKNNGSIAATVHCSRDPCHHTGLLDLQGFLPWVEKQLGRIECVTFENGRYMLEVILHDNTQTKSPREFMERI